MKINGLGCCLIDYLYTNCNFDDEKFTRLLSQEIGDGGMTIGGLVFSEDLEQFAGQSYEEILTDLIAGRVPDGMNIGGPAIVSLIHIAQILGNEHTVSFYGMSTQDEICSQVKQFIDMVPVEFVTVAESQKRYPTTDVFSDPTYHGGAGERSFVNTIGAVGDMTDEDLPESFFDMDLLMLGGTALVPQLHKALPRLLRKAKEHGTITVVGTVYDFMNEKRAPGKPWPLTDDYRNIDLLIVDEEEALKISGKSDTDNALDYFVSEGLQACAITMGSRGALIWSGGEGIFAEQDKLMVPVCRTVDEDLAKYPEKRGDTTGCGDNFLGGVTVSLCIQMESGKQMGAKNGDTTKPDLLEAVRWGTVSGGFACYSKGGTYFEREAGEKRAKLEKLLQAYRQESRQ